MKIAGHTMGTPELTLEQAAMLFSKIGIDAIEIIYQDGYGCGFSSSTTMDEVSDYKKLFDKLGIEVSCLVPYASDYNLPNSELRQKAIDEAKRCIDFADVLGARNIRIYGGTFVEGDDDFELKLSILTDSMRQLADIAAPAGVSLVIENHFNTMTTGPKITRDIVAGINRSNVRILYDQANICFLSGEDYSDCIEIQKEYIGYVHVKDLIFKSGSLGFKASSVTHVNEDERMVSSRIPGEGILLWDKIVKLLRDTGYDGYLSLEYERRWHSQDLPLAEIGMKKGADYLRRILNTL